jgi:hypothetical protein
MFSPFRRPRPVPGPRRTSFRPRCEALEDRCVPAALTPIGNTASQRFVSEVFIALLDRNPSQGEATALGNFLDQGLINRLQFVQAVQLSPEFFGRVVTQDFQTILGRSPDTGALKVAVAFLQGGGTNAQLQTLLFGSPEFFNRSGGTDTGFVNALFTGATGQTLDTVTQGTLVGLLNAGFSGMTLAQFLLSTPAPAQQQITNSFEQFLGRAPTGGELNAFTALAQSGQPNLGLAIILSSQEFFNLV